jgi:hypothetical protein
MPPLTLQAFQASDDQVAVVQHAQVRTRPLDGIGMADCHQVAMTTAQVAADMAQLDTAGGQNAARLCLRHSLRELHQHKHSRRHSSKDIINITTISRSSSSS